MRKQLSRQKGANVEQRLIDADAFKKYLKEKFKDVKDQFQTEKMRSLAQKITNDFCCDIDEQPTVDAVPVVRCRECRWACLAPQRQTATCMKNRLPFTHDYDWFCADGERRSE